MKIGKPIPPLAQDYLETRDDCLRHMLHSELCCGYDTTRSVHGRLRNHVAYRLPGGGTTRGLVAAAKAWAAA